jgi:hypothetical protein
VALQLRTIRTRTHKMTLEQITGAGELYDLVHDPYEMDNLFDDPAARARRAEMTDMIRSRPDDAMVPPPQPVGMA